jgi:hypothetical protein
MLGGYYSEVKASHWIVGVSSATLTLPDMERLARDTTRIRTTPFLSRECYVLTRVARISPARGLPYHTLHRFSSTIGDPSWQ